MTPAELVAWRKANNYTQKQLAAALGYSERQVVRWEMGDYAMPRFLELKLKELKPRKRPRA